MGELVMFPMTYVSLEKGKRTCSVAFANSSKRILWVVDLPDSWVHMDATLGVTRLRSAGWEEVGRGKVKEDV
jgi:hypothetical protein